MLSGNQLSKRSFDLIVSLLGLLCLFWLVLVAWVLASLDTRSNGFFLQKRVGRYGNLFKVIKIKTMKPVQGNSMMVTTSDDERITKLGRFWRKTKIDELPQLINVLLGQMSLVGPRPDVPGYADKLKGEERLILSIRPGITGPATLAFRNEEELLAMQVNPQKYNDEVIYPAKVKINLDYIYHWAFKKDLKYILKTILG